MSAVYLIMSAKSILDESARLEHCTLELLGKDFLNPHRQMDVSKLCLPLNVHLMRYLLQTI
jgi:hypothetical protein